MGIPLEVLVKWSNQGKSENSKNTYAALRKVVEDRYGSDVEIFLQGSYHNATHVKENSDIDVVVIHKSLVVHNTLYGLQGEQNLRSWKNILYNSINGAQNFRFALGGKTIKYGGNMNYVPADIVPCAYYKGVEIGAEVGTLIYDGNSGQYFVNYPKQHYNNGCEKSSLTDGNYKKTVRMFKNARNIAVKKGLLYSEDIAPSYFLECLLYNVPNSAFVGNEQTVFYNVEKWLYEHKNNLSNLLCQNRIQKLFGFNSMGRVTYNKWNTADAIKFIDSIAKLWDNWGS